MARAHKSIYGALAANMLIALTKFIAGGFTNSASMMAEGIHSVVDSVNQLLLLYGIRRSRKAPDQSRPFGYGKELYFYSFIVSILIFGLGGGISIYQGIQHIMHPQALGNPFWNYVVLGVSVLFEGASLLIAAREFDKLRAGQSWWDAIVRSKDPSSFLVLFEDSAAVLGLLIVFICMAMAHAYQVNWLDGVATLLVGVLLVGVSYILARESRSLLLGEGIAPETRTLIRQLAEKDAAVVHVLSILSTYQSPDEIVLMLVIGFRPDLDTEDITDAIDRIRESIKKQYPLVRYVIIQPQDFETNTQ